MATVASPQPPACSPSEPRKSKNKPTHRDGAQMLQAWDAGPHTDKQQERLRRGCPQTCIDVNNKANISLLKPYHNSTWLSDQHSGRTKQTWLYTCHLVHTSMLCDVCKSSRFTASPRVFTGQSDGEWLRTHSRNLILNHGMVAHCQHHSEPQGHWFCVLRNSTRPITELSPISHPSALAPCLQGRSKTRHPCIATGQPCSPAGLCEDPDKTEGLGQELTWFQQGQNHPRELCSLTAGSGSWTGGRPGGVACIAGSTCLQAEPQSGGRRHTGQGLTM